MSETRQLTVTGITRRFITGGPLNGKHRTNATFFRKGDTSVIPHDRPGKWSHLPRYQRAAARHATWLSLAGLVWAWFYMQWIVCTVVAVVCFLVILSLALLVYERRQQTADKRMPSRVRVRNIQRDLDTGTEGTPVIGQTFGKTVVRLDLDNDAPHVAASIGTGGGKSSFLRGVIAQGLHDGWEHVTIIDPKYVSLSEFKGHPRVTYCKTWPDQWDAFERERAIMDDRYRALDADDTLTFPRRVIILEEGNSWAAEMRMYWIQHLRGKGMAPVLQTLAFILFKGRQCNVNVIGVWQRMGVNVVGSPDARDSFGCKIMCRFTPSAWKSIIGTTPIPGSSRHRGRAIVVVGNEETDVQLTMWTPKQAREWADAGTYEEIATDLINVTPVVDDTRTPDPLTTGFGQSAVSPPVSDTDERDDMSETADTETLPDHLVTLEEALNAEYVTDLTIGGLRITRSRPGFPVSKGKRGRSFLYSARDMQAWNLRRISGTPR